jgi:hypothetical protein
MSFKASLGDPSREHFIDLGKMEPAQIIGYFKSVDWILFLRQMENKSDNEIHCSPSFEVENIQDAHGLCVSIVGDPKDYEWYIFFKRPVINKGIFGIGSKNGDKLTDLTGQNFNDVINSLEALIKGDYEYLEEKIR